MGFGLFGYNLYLHLLGFFSLPAIMLRSIKKGKLWVKIPERKEENSLSTMWILAESAGEVILAKTIISAFHTQKQDTSWLIVTTTNSGYRMAQKLLGEFELAYIPIDYPSFIKTLLKRFYPTCILMIENFFWPNLLRQASIHEIKTAVVNARVSERVLRRNRFFKDLFKTSAQQVDRFYLQSPMFKDAYLQLGVNNTGLMAAGDLKFDQQLSLSGNERTDIFLDKLKLSDQERLVVAGSTHHGEETLILDAFEHIRKEYPETLLLLAPRHLERIEEVGGLLTNHGLRYQLFSKLQRSGERVILLDTMGDLSTLYGIAYLSIVGGSFVDGIGGHNILEPVAQGSPVFYGPFIEGFKAPHEVLREAGVGFLVSDSEVLAQDCLHLIQDPDLRGGISDRAKRLIQEHKGVSKKIAESVHDWVSQGNDSEGLL